MHCASSHNQKKDNNKFKNKKQPELPENWTVWKSNSQGVKENTFIQTGSRGRDGQLGREDSQKRRWLEDWVGKDAAGGPSKAAAGGSSDRQHNPGLQHGEIKPQTTDWKHLWGLEGQQEKLPGELSQESSLERLTGS